MAGESTKGISIAAPAWLRTSEPSSQERILKSTDVQRLFGVVYAQLRKRTLSEARTIVAKAGIFGFSAPEQYWAPFLAGVQEAFNKMGGEAQLAALLILADEFSDQEEIKRLSQKHGFAFIGNTFVPIGLIDSREATFLPESSATELAKAMNRLAQGDNTGAITAACGAVDAVTQQLYEQNALGEPGRVSFAAKVNTVLQKLKIFESLKFDLMKDGMSEKAAREIVDEMSKATNHAAQMLQNMRKSSGDVHGSKKASQRIAYEAVKWASAICGLLEQ
jgi:hypothetical protein